MLVLFDIRVTLLCLIKIINEELLIVEYKFLFLSSHYIKISKSLKTYYKLSKVFHSEVQKVG